MNRKELIARLKEISERMNVLAHQDSCTEDEQNEFDALAAEYERRQQQLDRFNAALRATEDAANRELRNSPVPRDGVQMELCGPDGRSRYGNAPASGRGIAFRTADGREVRSLARGEPLTPRGFDGPSVGELLRSMLTGNPEHVAHCDARAAVSNVNTQGGALLTPAMSSRFIDLARAASVVEKAGATVLPLETGETILAKLDSDATGHWIPEMGPISASEPGFNRIVLRPRTLAALVPVSIELAEDSQNAASLIEETLQRALAAELDRVVLLGKGSEGEPRGITMTAGVNEESSVGTPDSYDEVADAVTAILEANYDGEISDLAWVQNPTIAGIYAKLVTENEGQPLQPGPWVAPLKRLHTTNLPTHTALVGSFREVILGMRTTGVKVQVFDCGSATSAAGVTTTAPSQLAKFIRAYWRVDSCIMRPAWMTKMTGITTGG